MLPFIPPTSCRNTRASKRAGWKIVSSFCRNRLHFHSLLLHRNAHKSRRDKDLSPQDERARQDDGNISSLRRARVLVEYEDESMPSEASHPRLPLNHTHAGSQPGAAQTGHARIGTRADKLEAFIVKRQST